MASADYWLCDVCGNKSFYDANLDWDWDEGLTRSDRRMLPSGAGDMAAICVNCAVTYEVVVRERTS